MITKQHHYVLVFDTKTNGWTLDSDCEEVRFPDGTIWNEDTQLWESGYLGDGTYEPMEEQLGEALNSALAVLNSITSEGDN
jgi:hypothetical protein